MLRNVLFLYNPASGDHPVTDYLDDIVACYQDHGYRMTLYRLRFDDTDRLTIEAAASESFDHLLLAGGDGTLNYLVNHIKACGPDIPIAVLPVGTANDFATLLGMPQDPMEACRAILEGAVQPVDLGIANGRYFVNVFSCGLFTDVSQKTPTAWKNNLGKIAYYINGIGDLPRFRSMDLSIRTDGGAFDSKAVTFSVYNGRTAGTLPIAYQSEGDDGLLDVLILKGDSPLTPLRTAMRYLPNIVLRKGYPSGIVHIKCSHLHALSTRDEHTDMDGQPGPSFPIDIRCAHNALRVIVPPKAMQRALWTETLPTLPGRNGAKQ